MKQLQKALTNALELVFNPSRGIHAYNMQKGTSAVYLQGHVDQAMAECSSAEERRAWMPMNRNASYVSWCFTMHYALVLGADTTMTYMNKIGTRASMILKTS